MESIQQQIDTLTRKVEQVYHIVDRLERHIFQSLDSPVVGGAETAIDGILDRYAGGKNALRLPPEGIGYSNRGYADLPGGSNYCYDKADWVIAQQDTLIDGKGIEIAHHQLKEQDLSPQVQIQRLTAQLTAAYNRIAALEEQLLANRWK
ncbi:hypothetical protein [Chamaesiphon sp.]|uniref:hypothetical protein n=1 Tax=Chamaesiphon sp. TaxID=2814140 RepID=UPI0035936D92